ncbi:putative nucleotidyltransferase, ribonuclease H [Tanacetum coccineum]
MVNTLLELYLQRYVNANQHDSAKLLDFAQFSYNKEQTEATRKRPIELVMGRQLLTLNALPGSYKGKKATKKIMKWVDEKRRHTEFEVQDLAMVKLLLKNSSHLGMCIRGQYEDMNALFPLIELVGKMGGYEMRVSKRATTEVVTSYDRDVNEILLDCTVRRQVVTSYKECLIK